MNKSSEDRKKDVNVIDEYKNHNENNLLFLEEDNSIIYDDNYDDYDDYKEHENKLNIIITNYVLTKEINNDHQITKTLKNTNDFINDNSSKRKHKKSKDNWNESVDTLEYNWSTYEKE